MNVNDPPSHDPLGMGLPDPALIVPIGPAGAGKSTLAQHWPATRVLELDAFRAIVSDDHGDQSATDDAVAVLNRALDARLKRRLTTYLDATNLRRDVREDLVQRAHDNGVDAVALVLLTPLTLCIARNARRPANRRVPEAEVRRQHAAAAAAAARLHEEKFDHVHVL